MIAPPASKVRVDQDPLQAQKLRRIRALTMRQIATALCSAAKDHISVGLSSTGTICDVQTWR